MAKGDFKFSLDGKKLKGMWVLVRTHGFGGSSKPTWLLIKHRDKFASTEDIAVTQPKSIKSKRLLAEIAEAGGGDVAKAATGDPQPAKGKVAKGGTKKPAKASKAGKATKKSSKK